MGVPSGGSGGGGGASATPAPVTPPGSEALAALRAHLGAGESYGEGPGAQAVADHIRSRVSDFVDGAAVRVLPGTPTRVVALVQCAALSEIDMADRRALVELVAGSVLADMPGVHLGVAVQGEFLFGAAGIQRPGDAVPRSWVGSTVSVTEIEQLLAPQPVAALPAPGVPGAAPGVPTPAPPPQPGVAAGPNADIVSMLNEICPDTFCEGEYDYRFTALDCAGPHCALAFTASREGSVATPGSVRIPSTGLRDPEGEPGEEVLENVGDALAVWERGARR